MLADGGSPVRVSRRRDSWVRRRIGLMVAEDIRWKGGGECGRRKAGQSVAGWDLRPARVPEAEQRVMVGHAGQGVADGYGPHYLFAQTTWSNDEYHPTA
jgi:hypothetical protein